MKKQSLLKFLAASVICSSAFIACDKNDDPAPVPDKVQKIMKNWKITNITTTKKNEPATDSSLLKDCMSDDLIKFNTGGEYDFQDGTAKCDSSVFHYAKGVWAYNLVSDSILLGATPKVKYMSWKVVKLNDSVLQVKYIDSLNPASKVTKTISFKN